MSIFKKLLLLCSICLINGHSYKYIPVFMWETSNDYNPVPVLEHVKENRFTDILLSKYNNSKNIILFLEENLSPEDFTTKDCTGQNVFATLSNLKSYAQVNYYPFVETPFEALQNLPDMKILEITLDDLPDFKIEPNQVLLIHLDVKANETRSQMLHRHDSLINSVYKSILSQNEKIIALYTARYFHNKLCNNLGYRMRNLMEAEEEVKPSNKVMVKHTSDTLFYATGTIVCFVNEKKYEIKEISQMTSDNDVVIVKGSDLSLRMTFIDDQGYWILDTIEIITEEDIYAINLKDVFAIYGFSYHCNDFVSKMYANGKDIKLIIPGFQVQRFKEELKEPKFGTAYDCIGFTTPAIWSGIIVTFVLANILGYGLCMIIDIKTNDRFDDPKGPTISVRVGE